ncbi:energy transducer TonB [Alkalimarinus alittae]|uniref:Protein TonB n=1 Tax=Alkalimarinus alittae TaxID=2961619 RepID=A0ABY6N302_9ALTE|nr:energy transducer TonB [Alkalimarinus alittae]UZE96466.1 TonB family protein [Alkalimarinus alittae]
MLKLVNRYAVWILLAIGLHALLLMSRAPTFQPMQLRLHSGHQAVSLTLKQVGENQAIAEPRANPVALDVVQASPLKTTNTNASEAIKKIITKAPSVQNAQPALQKKQPFQNTSIKPADVKVNVTNAKPVKPIYLDRPAARIIEKSETLPKMLSSESSTPTKPKGAVAIAKPLSANSPNYPRRAIMRNQQGRVKVSFIVDKRGYVDNIELIESSGYALLDQSVFRFAEEERFIPAMQDGIPIASTQLYLFRFVLE